MLLAAVAPIPPVHPEEALLQNALHGVRLLVVDDVSDNRLLILRYLKNSGANIGQASSGEEALKLIEEFQPDMVLMDIQMPVMDGYETTTKARRNGYRGPIVALTAHAMKEEVQKCLNAGCDEVMTKPARRKELIETIFRLTKVH